MIPATAELQEAMKLAAVGQKVFVLERLRMADGEPLILETTYIPYYLCEGIESTDFSEASLYAALENRYGLVISHAEETLAAMVIPKPAALLKCKNGLAGYKTQRTSYLSSGYIGEYTQSITRGDRCVFRLELSNSKSPQGGVLDFQRKLNV